MKIAGSTESYMKSLIHILAAWMLLSSNAAGAPPEAVAVHCFRSSSYNRCFYTLDESERDILQTRYWDVWTYEGPAFLAFASRSDNRLAPVHRFWSGWLNTYFYTLDEHEAEGLLAISSDVWTYEGVAFYAYPANDRPAGTFPVHRFWSDALATHFYTTSDRERFSLAHDPAGLWQYEGPAYGVYPQEDERAARIVKGPAIHWVAPDSATILWETDVPAPSHVRYGVDSVSQYDLREPEPATLHRVVLSRLAADTRYVYRVGSESAWREGSFTTAPAPDRAFRFAVCSDTQWNSLTHAQIAQGILADRPRIVLHAGDLVSAGRDWDIWETEFFEPASELLANVPLIPIPGNHGYFGSGPPWFFYYFDRPVSQGGFALTYGAVRFVGIDTSAPFAPGSPQHQWLLEELASPAHNDALWRVVVLHEPPFTATTGHGDNLAVQEHLVPLFEQRRVDVVFSGHSHAYERYLHHNIVYIVTGGGGGPLYPLLPDATPPIRQVGLSLHHHCSIDVDPALGTMTIAAVDVTGRIVDLVRLHKHAPTQSFTALR